MDQAENNSAAAAPKRRPPLVDPVCRDLFLVCMLFYRFPYFVTEHAYKEQCSKFIASVPSLQAIRLTQLLFSGQIVKAFSNSVIYGSVFRFNELSFDDDLSAKLFLFSCFLNRSATLICSIMDLVLPDVEGNVVYSVHTWALFSSLVSIKLFVFMLQSFRSFYLYWNQDALTSARNFVAHVGLDFAAFVL